MKLLIWDFDGTLGYQKRGYFSESILQVIRETDPGTRITVEQIRPRRPTAKKNRPKPPQAVRRLRPVQQTLKLGRHEG